MARYWGVGRDLLVGLAEDALVRAQASGDEVRAEQAQVNLDTRRWQRERGW